MNSLEREIFWKTKKKRKKTNRMAQRYVPVAERSVSG